MIRPPRLLFDDHIPLPLYKAVRSHNELPGGDVLCVEKVGSGEVPLGTSDPDLLLWAERNDAILVSGDRNTWIAHFRDHLLAGRHSAGVFILAQTFSVPLVVQSLVLSCYAADPSEWRDRVVFLPF